MREMSERFDGKAAIVTGTSSGIGKAIALDLAAAGAAVCGSADRNAAGAQATDDEIARAGGKGICVQADVSTAAGCDQVVQAALKAFGRVDILVNNAGITRVAPLERIDEAFWDTVLDTNLKSAYLMSRLAVEDMLRRGAGSVINISSVHAVATHAGHAAYAASKAGMCGMTRALACEYGARGIRFNCILPGAIDLGIYPRDNAAVDRRTWRPGHSDIQVMKRRGSPHEVAAAVCFLASESASYVNGVTLAVDGGLLGTLRDR